jgi:hypothetical protein
MKTRPTLSSSRLRRCITVTVAWCVFLGAGCTPPVTDDGNGDTGLPAESQRAAFQSQCAQNVIFCTTSWPTAIARVVAGEGQTATETETGFRIEGTGDDGTEPVNLVGDESVLGNGATELTYSWSAGATDENPLTLEPGEAFSTEANPVQNMQVGFHYIRLHVVNDVVQTQVESEEFGVLFEEVNSFDFVEIEIEIVE